MSNSDIDWTKALRALRNRFRAHLPALIANSHNPLELLSAIIAVVALKLLHESIREDSGKAGIHDSPLRAHYQITFASGLQFFSRLGAGMSSDIQQALPPFTEASFDQALSLLSNDDRFCLLWQSLSSLGFVYQIWGDTFRTGALNAVQTPNKEISNETLIGFTQIYTPPWVVDRILTDTLMPLLAPDGQEERCEQKSSPTSELLTKTFRLLDPACGAGHFLLRAFDHFSDAYAGIGMTPKDFVPLILTKNLFGSDIDKRGLCVSGLSMNLKALSVLPTFEGVDLNLASTAEDANGSHAIKNQAPITAGRAKAEVQTTTAIALPLGSIDSSWLDRSDHFLSQPFDVVVTNPPYIGRRLLSRSLKEALAAKFPLSKSDLNAAFIEGSLRFLKDGGYFGAITQASMLFLPSYREFRKQLEYENDVIMAETCGTGVFPLLTGEKADSLLLVLRRNKERGGSRKPFTSNKAEQVAPILEHPSAQTLSTLAEIKQGLATTDNERFVRYRWEVDEDSIGKDWVPYVKGAGSERWLSDNYHVVKWSNDGEEIKRAVAEAYPYLKGKTAWVVKNEQYYFKEGLCFSFINKDRLAVRQLPAGSIFDVASSAIFAHEENRDFLLGYLNSSIASQFASSINPTINLQVGDLKRIPVPKLKDSVQRQIAHLAKACCATKRELLSLLAHCGASPDKHNRSKTVQSFELFADRVASLLKALKALEKELDELVLAQTIQAFSLDSTLEMDVENTRKQIINSKEHDSSALAARYIHGKVGTLLDFEGNENPRIIESQLLSNGPLRTGQKPFLPATELVTLENALGQSLQKYFEKRKVLDLARKFRGHSRYLSLRLQKTNALLFLSARAIKAFAENGLLLNDGDNDEALAEGSEILKAALHRLSKIENWRTRDLIVQLDGLKL